MSQIGACWRAAFGFVPDHIRHIPTSLLFYPVLCHYTTSSVWGSHIILFCIPFKTLTFKPPRSAEQVPDKPYLERQRHNTAVKSGTETFLFVLNGNCVWAVPKQQPLCFPHVTEGDDSAGEKENIVFPASHRCPAPPDETSALTSAFHPVVIMAVAWFFCLPRWIQSTGDPEYLGQITIIPLVPPDPSAITAPPTVCNYRCYYAVAALPRPWGGNLHRILCLSCWFSVPLLILSSKSQRLKLPMWHNQRLLTLLNTVVCFSASSPPQKNEPSLRATLQERKNEGIQLFPVRAFLSTSSSQIDFSLWAPPVCLSVPPSFSPSLPGPCNLVTFSAPFTFVSPSILHW